MPVTIDEIIDNLAGAHDLGEPATPEQLARAGKALGSPLPAPLSALYRRADGASIGAVDIFTLDDEFLDVNKRRSRTEKALVFFASDGSDGFFAIDAANRMKKGAEAVFWVDRGSSQLSKTWIFTAPTLEAFLEQIARGEQPWKKSSIVEADEEAMAAAFAANKDRWSGGPPVDPGATFHAGSRLGIRVSNELEALLEIANGLRIPAAGIEVDDLDHIEPVPGTTKETGKPGALWFARDNRGNRYAMTTIGWRGSEGSEVVRVAQGQSPHDGPILGSLPSVVVAWLEGRTP